MATISLEAIAEVLEKVNQPSWHWVIDGEDIVYADADNPPTHSLSGHWEYMPTLQEVYEDAAPFFNSAPNKEHNISSKGCQVPMKL